jgi:hypothetical protein
LLEELGGDGYSRGDAARCPRNADVVAGGNGCPTVRLADAVGERALEAAGIPTRRYSRGIAARGTRAETCDQLPRDTIIFTQGGTAARNPCAPTHSAMLRRASSRRALYEASVPLGGARRRRERRCERGDGAVFSTAA